MEEKAKLNYTIDKDEKKSYGQIAKELYNDDWYIQEELFQKFKNSRKTGLVDRIEKYTGLHMEWYEDNDKSDMLRLVKYLMQVESKFPLLEILSQPTLSEISFSRQCVDYDYELELESIRSIIRAETTEGYADRSDNIYYRINVIWDNYINCIFNMVLRSYAQIIQNNQSEYEKSQQELKAHLENINTDEKKIVSEIVDVLKKEVKEKKKETKSKQAKIFSEGYDKVKDIYNETFFSEEQYEQIAVVRNAIEFLVKSIAKIAYMPNEKYISDIRYKHNAIDTFYSIFNRYYVRCFATSLNSYDEQSCVVSPKVQGFIANHEGGAMTFDFFERMERTLAGRLNKSEFEESFSYEIIKDIVQKGVPVKLTEADFRYALNNLKTVARWWGLDICDETSISAGAAITIMQELAYLRNTKKECKERFNKHEAAKTFSAIIAKPETADRALKSILNSQLNYRLLVNITGEKRYIDLIKMLTDLLKRILEILMLYNNIEDAEDASRYMYNSIEYVLRFVSTPDNSVEDFLEMIKNKAGDKYELHLRDTTYLQHILHESKESLDDLAERIVKKLIEHEEKTFIYYPKIDKWMDAVMVYEEETKTIEFKSVSLSADGDSIRRMKETGLHKMCGK